MIDITNIKTGGWEVAIRGMRNSRESWDKSDSGYFTSTVNPPITEFSIGQNDLELASNLAKLGGSHAKFRRMIIVSMDIVAPLYWWKEFDTYKIGTVSNSTSTMYSITKKEFVSDDFSHCEAYNCMSAQAGTHLLMTINVLNELRQLYLNSNDPKLKRMYWYDMIQILPCSYNQKRTIMMNYEVVSHIVNERLHHKLIEWQEFCRKMLCILPYAKELIFFGDGGLEWT